MAYALQALITQSGVPDVSSADEETDAADEVAVADEADAEVADEASADDATDTDNKEEE